MSDSKIFQNKLLIKIRNIYFDLRIPLYKIIIKKVIYGKLYTSNNNINGIFGLNSLNQGIENYLI